LRSHSRCFHWCAGQERRRRYKEMLVGSLESKYRTKLDPEQAAQIRDNRRKFQSIHRIHILPSNTPDRKHRRIDAQNLAFGSLLGTSGLGFKRITGTTTPPTLCKDEGHNFDCCQSHTALRQVTHRTCGSDPSLPRPPTLSSFPLPTNRVSRRVGHVG